MINTFFEGGDQTLEVAGLAGQLRCALPLANQRVFDVGLLPLALSDQQCEPWTFVCQRFEITVEPFTFFGNFVAKAHHFTQVSQDRIRFLSHFGQHRTERVHHRPGHRVHNIEIIMRVEAALLANDLVVGISAGEFG